jgi:hypothetical protein
VKRSHNPLVAGSSPARPTQNTRSKHFRDIVSLSETELDRLIEVAFPVDGAPKLGRLERFPIAPKTPPSASGVPRRGKPPSEAGMTLLRELGLR